ncbi:Dolichyl-diphosphooligosaccharide--protein glycosyltransferase subunit DAD1 [Labeo rohita]|uniref:Dolichyl-diphosphooligosaccharide--protein glycosyltransferase subunit DAD1 n=1 Tax=Labeo rohita TaxID=84645 RepID=A0ABQ8MYM0_LABRO|nr:Dolichyl-diphosphooligosaccharide--protein glycosyltransferase subunit DAD1 [Labeo rohita]
MIDAYLLYILLTGVFQFLYCLLVGTFPFNSFLSGFISCVGSFILAVCLRIQINPQNKRDFLTVSPERAFADFLFAHTVLHLVVLLLGKKDAEVLSHSTSAMILPLLLICLVLGDLPGSHCTVSTVGDLAVLEGGSVTVPCHYNPQYISHVKYWCQGRMREFCTSLARTDEPESAPNAKGRVTIADDPTQHVFTVSMRNLTEDDSGWYWCGVELGGMSSDKRWCRSGSLNSCMVTDSEGIFSSRNVFIHDDRNSMFTVTLQQLEMRDSGWYWCGAGQQQVAVHVSVTAQTTTRTSHRDHSSTTNYILTYSVETCVSSYLGVSSREKKQKHRGTNEMNDSLTICPWREGDYKNASKMYIMKMQREETMQRFDKRTVSLKKFIACFLWLITVAEVTLENSQVSVLTVTEPKPSNIDSYWSINAKKMYMMKMQKEETSQLFDKRTVSLKKFIVCFLWLITENPQGSVLKVTESKPGFERNRFMFVHISLLSRDATTLSSTTPVSVNSNQTASSEEQQNEDYLYLEVWIPAVVLLMVIVIVVSAVALKKHNNKHITEVNRDRANDAGNGASSSSAIAESDVTYTTVTVQPKTKASSPVSVEDDVTYSSVHR